MASRSPSILSTPAGMAAAAALVVMGAAAFGLWRWARMSRRPGESLATAAGRQVVEVATDAGAGVVYGIGDAVGVPRTDLTECEQAIADGRWLAASAACPAGRFISAGWSAAFD